MEKDQPKSNTQCGICEEKEEITKLDCKHTFCKDCLKEYFKEEITNSKFPIICPGNKNECKKVIPHKTVLSFLDEKMKNKFLDFSLKKYFSDNSEKLSWCPSPGCPYGFELDPNVSKFSCPLCNKIYCLRCRSEYHEGKSCMKEKDDKEFFELAKTIKMKQCPKCKFWIEKNEGCNHITCKCKYEFCYICGKSTKTNHQNCKYNVEAVLEEEEEKDNVGVDVNNNEQRRRNETARRETTRREFFANVIDNTYSNFERRDERRYINVPTSTRNDEKSNVNCFLNNYTDKKDLNERPRKKDGTLDMRFSINQNSTDSNKIKLDNLPLATSLYCDSSLTKKNVPSSLPTKNDGTLDMRFSVNKEYVSNCSSGNTSAKYTNYSGSGSSYGNTGPTKKDGTLDMRYSVNKQYENLGGSSPYYQPNYSTSDYSRSYCGAGPTKKDGTLDMRYSVNKYSGGSSSSSYCNQGNSSSARSNSYGSYCSGPTKKDGTPDMRYSANKRR